MGYTKMLKSARLVFEIVPAVVPATGNKKTPAILLSASRTNSWLGQQHGTQPMTK